MPADVVESPPMRALVLSLIAACGPTPNPAPDAAGDDDAAQDAPPDRCNYRELRDTSNDDVAPATGTPEDTGISFGTQLVVCGTFDETHFDGDITVDIDTYLFSLATDADVLVRIHGAGSESIELVGLDVYAGAAFDQLVGNNTFYGDHGVAQMRLPAGTYELAAFALHAEAIPSAVPYEITVTADTPDTRCAALASGGYTEVNDGTDNIDNNMIAIPSGSPPSLTAGADVPEPTGFAIEPASPRRVTGSLADLATADQYEDKDTFAFTTGAANELAVRLDWTVATNLDFLVFEENDPSAVTRAIAAGTSGPEFETFAVKPNTTYWLLVGGKVGGAFPASYSASLCGASFEPQ